MKRFATLALGVFFLGTGSASALTVTAADGVPDHPYERWVRNSYLPAPDLDVVVAEEPCPGLESATGCTLPDSNRIWLHTTRFARMVFLHELGHQYDFNLLTDSLRSRVLRWMGSVEWAGAEMERFAVGYADCASHRRWTPRLAPYPPAMQTPRDQRALCRALRAS